MKVTVYDKDGNPTEVDGVDAKEYVASGGWFMKPPAEKKKPGPKTQAR